MRDCVEKLEAIVGRFFANKCDRLGRLNFGLRDGFPEPIQGCRKALWCIRSTCGGGSKEGSMPTSFRRGLFKAVYEFIKTGVSEAWTYHMSV